jgi:hypothetical protein
MVMIHGLRGRKPVIRVLSWSFSSWPHSRPENTLLFGLFHALPRSCRGMPPGEPVRVRRVLRGVGVEAVLESCFHSCRRRPRWGASYNARGGSNPSSSACVYPRLELSHCLYSPDCRQGLFPETGLPPNNVLVNCQDLEAQRAIMLYTVKVSG